jgi:subtilisin family serine protease
LRNANDKYTVAAAEVSGIVALLLERNPKLTPADIRRILTASAKRLAPGERDDDFGSGLIDPLKALQLADPRTAASTPPVDCASAKGARGMPRQEILDM